MRSTTITRMRYIVTGASRGIGAEIVKCLARDGHEVLAISRQTQKESIDGVKHIVFNMDSDQAPIHDLIALLGNEPIDGVVMNAGVLINKAFESSSTQDIHELFQVNVFAPMAFLRQLKPLLNPQAHIILIGSMGGVQGSAKFPGLAWYSATKGALAILTECLAEEWKEIPIYVNCLALGAVQTEMFESAFPGFQAPVTPPKMGSFIADFLQKGQAFFNGKILPVSVSTP